MATKAASKPKSSKEGQSLSNSTTVPALEPKYGLYNQYKPGEEEYRALKWVYNRYNAMKDSWDRQHAAKDWDKWEKQWEGWREERGDDDWQSNHVVPITMGTVEAAMAEMIDQNTRPLILPLNSDDKARAQVMKIVDDFVWEAADGDTELFNIIKDAIMLGTGIGQEYYWADKRMIQVLKGLDKNDNPEYEEVEQADFDGCYLECVKLQDFFVDENARTLNMGPYKARDCIRRYIMDIEDAKLFFSGPVWNQFNNAQYLAPGGDTNYYEFYKPPEGIKANQIEVLWYWSTKPKDSLIIVANNIVLVMGPNPYRHKQLPFVRAIDIKRTHRFYGKGEAEALESIQDEMDLSRRMMIDRNHLDIDKMFTGSSRIELDDEDLIARPHAFLPSDDPSGLKPIEYGDVPRSVQLGKDWLQEDAIRATGIDDRMASAQNGQSTATEAAIVKETFLKRIRMKVRLIERETLIPFVRMRVSNIVQFYTQPELEQIVGEGNSQKYQQEIATLNNQGKLRMVDGTPYRVNYREIRSENKKIDFDEKGKLQVVPEKGYHFFEAKPEYYVPTAKGGYQFRYAAGSSLPISEPLMQTKAVEMFDRLIPLALNKVGYDPVKLGDLLLEVNHYDPDDFHSEEIAQKEDQTNARVQMLTNLAMIENQKMMGGQQLPPTPYSTPAHTLIHIKFMQSPQFQNLDNKSPIIQHFTNHVVGEISAQQLRGQQPGQQGTDMPTPPAPEGSDVGTPNPQGAMGENPANPAQRALNLAKQTPPGQLNKSEVIPGIAQ